jgi:hypothetical protein
MLIESCMVRALDHLYIIEAICSDETPKGHPEAVKKKVALPVGGG